MPGIVVTNGSGLNPIQVMETVIAHYAEADNWYSRFIGESGMSVIQKITRLEKGGGDNIKATIFGVLGGAGKDGDAPLETNEEAMQPYQDSLLIDQKRHAIRISGKMTDQRSAVDLHKEASILIGGWGRNWMGRVMSVYLAGRRGTRYMPILPVSFAGFATNPLQVSDLAHTLWAGTAGTEAAMIVSDTFTTAVVDKADKLINLLINSGYPINFPMAGGEEQRVLKISPEQWFDLQQDPDWVAAQQSAGPRDKSNLLFAGGKGKWKGYEIFVDPAAVLFTTAGGITAASAQVLGCQAGLLAFGGVENATEGGGGKWAAVKETFDYGNQTGFAVATILGFKKTQMNAQDLGCFTINTGFTP